MTSRSRSQREAAETRHPRNWHVVDSTSDEAVTLILYKYSHPIEKPWRLYGYTMISIGNVGPIHSTFHRCYRTEEKARRGMASKQKDLFILHAASMLGVLR